MRILRSGVCFRLLARLVLTAASASALFAVPKSPSPPSYGVKVVEDWIPMKDGVRLAVTLFMPTSASPTEKFPAVLEYLPYRKDDGTAARDYPIHSYFAHQGYVSARVDIRGTGRSQGKTPSREYSEQEQEDGLEVIAWLAHQLWSNGNVGMFGISWGGFNSLQLAMRQPPALKAVIAICATEELFKEDVHYVDGLMHVDEFEVAMDLGQALPPSPDYPTDEKTLALRFDQAPWSLDYMRHQRDSEFWHAPERPLSSIRIPIFVIGGMLDGYRNSIVRILEQVKSPVKALIGPWNHSEPHDADFGPQIEWRDQAVRWWDQWLKDKNTGIMGEPPVAVYMRHWYAPDTNAREVPGEWRNEPKWPPPESELRTYYAGVNGSLNPSKPAQGSDRLGYIPAAGVEGGFWWGDLTNDQRPWDAYSLTYDSQPLTDDVAILGRPRVNLNVSASAPLADWFARLCDVAPDGTVALVTGVGISGAQRDNASQPADLESDRTYLLSTDMYLTSWVFPRGHRIRLAVSNAWFPTIWPTPYKMQTRLYFGGDRATGVQLPVVPLEPISRPQFAPPQESDRLTGVHFSGETWPGEWKVQRDEIAHSTRVVWDGSHSVEYPWVHQKHHEELVYEVADDRPDNCTVIGNAESIYDIKGRVLTLRGHLTMRSDLQNFYYSYVRELLENGALIRQKTWQETIPRDHQ